MLLHIGKIELRRFTAARWRSGSDAIRKITLFIHLKSDGFKWQHVHKHIQTHSVFVRACVRDDSRMNVASVHRSFTHSHPYTPHTHLLYFHRSRNDSRSSNDNEIASARWHDDGSSLGSDCKALQEIEFSLLLLSLVIFVGIISLFFFLFLHSWESRQGAVHSK